MTIPPDDRGFTLGDGLFETVRAEGGELRRLSAHLDRLEAGCAALGLPAPAPARVEQAMRSALEAAGLQAARAAVRLTWTAGSGGRGLDRPDTLAPRLSVTAAPAPRPSGPARLALASVARNDGSPASRLKTLSYLDNVLARAQARAAGADEAVMLNTRGEVACAAAANLFWERDGRLFTPALACGVLAGIMRGEVIAAAARLEIPLDEVRAPASALLNADAVFLTNSLIGLRPASSLGDRTFGAGDFAPRLSEICGEA